jgi:hypothetical protein
MSVSRWLSELVRERTRDEWPAGVREAAGSWSDSDRRNPAGGSERGSAARSAVMLLLDTNTLIYFFKGPGKQGGRVPAGDCSSGVTAMESRRIFRC